MYHRFESYIFRYSQSSIYFHMICLSQIFFVYLYNKRGRRLKRKSSIIQIEGVGAVPTSRSKRMVKDWDNTAQFKLPVIILDTAEEELRETRWTSSSKMVGQSHPSAQQAKVAQLVEHDLAKVRVAGSNPVFRSENLL